MKRIIFSLSLVCSVLIATAQAPQKLNYQGIARNGSGTALASATLGLRLTVHDLTAGGTVLYQETHAPTTNAYGLYNVAIGTGTVVSGTFNTIDWGNGDKYLQVEIDPAGGAAYADAGTTQLLSVPYALQANRAAKSTSLQLPYYDSLTSTDTLFKIENFGTGAAIEATSSSTAGSAMALKAVMTSTAPGGFSSAVRGQNNGTGGLGIGVYGSQGGSGWGVYGFTPSGIGIMGSSTSGFGMYAQTNSGTGLYATSSTGTAGNFAISNAANTNTALVVTTSGTGNGINANATTGIAVYGVASLASGVGVKAGNSALGSTLGTALEIENGAIKVSGTNKAAFTHTATVANKLSANGTDVDNPMCNGDANCILIVTQKLGTGVVYNNSPIGVYYNTIRSKWEIFNENNVAIPTGAIFNVLVIKQ